MNSPLAVAILIAYVPQSGSAAFYQNNDVVGLPDWVKDDRYDIDAKVGEADRAEWQKPNPQAAMLRAMMQTLLAERCKLAVHRDAKEIPVYSLVTGKNGPKFKPTNPDDPHPAGQALPGGGVVVPEATGLHFYGAPVNILASVLSSSAGRPVQDKTGLTGRYDFLLQRPTSGASAPMDGASASDPAHSIFSVVEDLGLKLEPAKGSVETLVVDHIERPPEY
jgi:bla regulator protein blaR1